MSLMRSHMVSMLLLVAACQGLMGQKFTTTVSSSKIGLGQQFKLTYTLDQQGTDFKAPTLIDFRVLSGPNQSHNMSVYNGQMTQTLSISYVLTPMKVGKFTIPGAQIKVKGKTLTSNAVNVQVVKGQAKAQANDPAQQQKQAIKDNVFIRLTTNKTKVYQGEQLIATYKIYTRASIVDYSPDQVPAFNGFYTQEITSKQHGSLKPEIYNGVRYNAAVLRQVVLAPQRSGTLTLEPYSMDMMIRVRDDRRARSVFDQFFGSYKDIPYKAVSNTVKLEVSPLPAQGKPADFTGSVGQFDFKATLDKSEVNTNDAINLKVSIKGKGNVKLIKKPEINFPSDFETYDPKINTNATTDAQGSRGSKTFEYLVIPRHAGEFTIAPITFNYFDPVAKKYVTAQSEEFVIKVNRGAGEAGEPTAGYRPSNKRDVILLGQDIRYIKAGGGKLREANSFFFGSAVYYVLLLVPSMLFLLLLVVRKRIREQQADTIGMRRKRATRIAEKRLAQARKHLDNSEQNAFYEEVFRSLYGYLSDKFSISLAELNKDKLREVLSSSGFDNPTIDELFGLLDNCEMARYAPVTHIQEQQVYDEASKFIHRIEGGNK